MHQQGRQMTAPSVSLCSGPENEKARVVLIAAKAAASPAQIRRNVTVRLFCQSHCGGTADLFNLLTFSAFYPALPVSGLILACVVIPCAPPCSIARSESVGSK